MWRLALCVYIVCLGISSSGGRDRREWEKGRERER